MNGGHIFPELPEVRKDQTQTAVWVQPEHAFMPRRELLGNPLSMLSMKEQIRRQFGESSVKGEFGKYATIRIRKVSVNGSFLKHVSSDQSKNRLAIMLHADQFSETLVRGRGIRLQNLLFSRQLGAVFIHFNRFGVAQNSPRVSLQEDQAPFDILRGKVIVVRHPQKIFALSEKSDLPEVPSHSAVSGLPVILNAGVTFGVVPANALGAIRRCIIRDDELKIGMSLQQYRVEALLKKPLPVEHRKTNADQGC